MVSPFALNGRTALVTGASRGIGWGIAEALAQAGAHVILNGRDAAVLEERMESLRARGSSASTLPFDVSDTEAARQVFAELQPLDILVCNAGIVLRKPSLETTASEWDQVLDMDLRTPFLLTRLALPAMLSRGRGRIIMVSSIVDRVARPHVAAYVTAKGGLSALTRALAVEFGPLGINVNAVAPGYVRTEATRPLQENAEFDAMVRRRTPLNRWGEPAEIGSAVVFLASDAASYVNGAILTVDGGMTVSL